MNLFSLYRVELRRLLLSKPVWLIVLLCLCAPLLGYSVYQSTASGTMTEIYIGNVVLAGTTVGAVLWAIMTVLETSRVHRSNTDVLTDFIASPMSLSAARVMSLMTLSAVVTVICAMVYLPFTAVKMEYLFDVKFYLMNFLVFMFPTWWISILMTEGFYQITRRIELTVILYAIMVYFSFSRWSSLDYFMRWINPFNPYFSDGFPSLWLIRMGIYTRLIWLCIAAGIWLLSLLCIRKYGKNLAVSFGKGLKKIYIPISAIICSVFAAALWIQQPFIDHGPYEYVQDEELSLGDEVISYAFFDVKTNPVTGTISGRAEYKLLQPCEGENVLKLNPGYDIKSITYGEESIDFRTVQDDVNGMRSTYFTLPNEFGQLLVIEYGGFPTVPRWHTVPVADDVVDEKYIELSVRAIVPRLMNYGVRSDMTRLNITIPDTLIPYYNFAPMSKYTENQDGTRTWSTSRSFYGGQFVAAKYVTKKVFAVGANIDFVYGEAYHTAVEKNNISQSIVDVLEYCTEHYGQLEFIEDNKMLLQLVSANLQGGYALPGVVVWGENVLSPSTLSDSAKGAGATEVFMHELIHQWWGGLGLICEDNDLWSEEGLTVYSTYRLVKEKYGELYAKKYYVDEWEKAVEQQDRNFYNRHPEYFDMLPEKYQARLRMANKEINQYMRMPLMILKAEELVGGEAKMDEILSSMYADREKYNYDKVFSYQDFLDYCGLTKEELYLD